MNSNGSSQVAKVLIFVFGLLIVFLALHWMLPWVSGSIDNRACVALDIVLLYLLVFLPPLLQPRLSQATTGRIVSLGVLYWGIGIYAAFTVVMVMLACTYLYLATRLLVILQLVGAFVMVGVIYASTTVHGHADAVEANEGYLMRNIDNIRSLASSVAIDASALGGAYADAAGKAARIGDELRYLSPVTNDQAYALEDQIYRQLGELSGLVQAARSGGVGPDELSYRADDLLLLIRQRKSLIN